MQTVPVVDAPRRLPYHLSFIPQRHEDMIFTVKTHQRTVLDKRYDEPIRAGGPL